jgi:hypothetical protein
MPEASRRSGFLAEAAFGEVLSGELGAQDLEGDRDLEVEIDGLVNPRKGPCPQMAGDTVLPDGTPQVTFWHGRVLYRGGRVE